MKKFFIITAVLLFSLSGKREKEVFDPSQVCLPYSYSQREIRNDFDRNETELMYALRNACPLSYIENLILNGANVHQKNQHGTTPLMFACMRGKLPVVQLLVTRGASINSEERQGQTPLYYASQNGHYNIVEFLLNRGADVNQKGDFGTALSAAKYEKHDNIVNLLKEHGAE